MRNAHAGFSWTLLLLAFGGLNLLAGCSSLPSAGPSAEEIVKRGHDAIGGVEVVSITPAVNSVLSRRRADSFIKSFGPKSEV